MAGVCGGDCMGREDRQRYGCRGCLETGGNPVWGGCRVTACCHSQGMQNCGECPSRQGCPKPEEMERLRQQWEQEEQKRQADWRAGLARRTPVLEKWLPVLFWLSLVSMALNLADRLPLSQWLFLALSAVSLALGIAALVAYWKLSVLSGRLRLVWRLQLATQIVGVAAIAAMLPALFRAASGPAVSDLMSVLGISIGLGLVGALAVTVMGMVATYQFCGAMAEELEQSDPPQADRDGPTIFRPGTGQSLAKSWLLLRKCIFWSLGALVGLIVLALIVRSSFGFALLLLLGALVAALVLAGCAIAHLVMLWKTGRFFRDLRPVDPPLPPAGEDTAL